MLAAESAFSMLQKGLKMENYWDNLRSSWIWEELYTARNYRPAFEYGLYPGLALSAVEHYILKGRSPVTLNHGKPDHEATRGEHDWHHVLITSQANLGSFCCDYSNPCINS
ncbi:Electron transfer flavoprotein-ubiquinone oxidoreductase, mitochondrial [Capsicum chinense]|nr:Electron transfer flavoprotein-ubiquinone oxidoreductase, mitochondrial [Capsicum chinense]